jgi:hypothetical protein
VTKQISQSLKVFLDRIIDYAGTFPPANLDLKSSFYNYLSYLKDSPHNWLLSKFVCPASKLEELDQIIKKENINVKTPVSFSVIGTSSVHSSEFLDTISRDGELIKAFENKYTKLIKIGAYEIRLPGDIFSMRGDSVLAELLKLISKQLGKGLYKSVQLFFESKPDENLPSLAQAIEAFNETGGKAGYKIRTGGVEPSAFPAPEKIAYAIKTCRDYKIPMKFTAGLHHPLRHYNESVKSKMYGFINVFAAGILHCCYELNADVLTEILTDEQARNFKFDDNSFHWKNLYVLLSKVQEARKEFMLSFGSCSFDEPVEDLKNLGII